MQDSSKRDKRWVQDPKVEVQQEGNRNGVQDERSSEPESVRDHGNEYIELPCKTGGHTKTLQVP